jgi:hypothetical protein
MLLLLINMSIHAPFYLENRVMGPVLTTLLLILYIVIYSLNTLFLYSFGTRTENTAVKT